MRRWRADPSRYSDCRFIILLHDATVRGGDVLKLRIIPCLDVKEGRVINIKTYDFCPGLFLPTLNALLP